MMNYGARLAFTAGNTSQVPLQAYQSNAAYQAGQLNASHSTALTPGRAAPANMRVGNTPLANGRACNTMTSPMKASYAIAANAHAQKLRYTPTAQRYRKKQKQSMQTPRYKYARTASGRAITKHCKNQVHAQDTKRNSRPRVMARSQHSLVYIENAATYFAGKDTPEATRDKELSFRRYTFDVDMLSEIFKGSLPDDEKGASIRERRRYARRIY